MATASPLAVRQSFAARFDVCPLSARLGEETAEFSTHPQGRGTILHGFTARMVQELIDSEQHTYPPDDAKKLMADEIVRSGLAIDAEEHDVLMGLAYKIAAERAIDIANVVDLEEPYESEIDGVVITGRPDRVEISDGVATITDYKTSFQINPESDLHGSFQLRWYAKHVADEYQHVHTFRLVEDYVRWGALRETTLTRVELEGVEDFLRTLVRRIRRAYETEHWPATPGSWCTTCPAAHKCPLPAQDRGGGAITDRETAQAVGDQLVALEAYVKERKAALKAWCSEGGAITVGDKAWDFRLSNDAWKVRDYETLLNAMDAADLAVDQYLQRVKGSTRFSYYRADAEANGS